MSQKSQPDLFDNFTTFIISNEGALAILVSVYALEQVHIAVISPSMFIDHFCYQVIAKMIYSQD